MEWPSKFSILLLDIEGTTTSISFVKDVLFPYVTENIGRYAMELYETEEFQADLEAMRHLSLQESNSDREVVRIPTDDKCAAVDALVQNVKHWVQTDKKLTALKQLQGHMWRDAYESHIIKGQ
uniref:Enolase-phosphatase E1 n=1 Tax=Plectus sambesii TaxID=2011161 RepID=A0A914XFL1_9BILA